MSSIKYMTAFLGFCNAEDFHRSGIQAGNACDDTHITGTSVAGLPGAGGVEVVLFPVVLGAQSARDRKCA